MAEEYSESQQEYEWSDDRVLDLIHEIEQLRYLWNPRDKDKKNRNKRNDAFNGLAEKFGVTAEQIKKKYLTLLQAYRNCRRKIRNSKLSGTGTSNEYKPVWFAYEALNKFMGDVYAPHRVTETTGHEEERDDSGESDDSINIKKEHFSPETTQTKEQEAEDVAADHRQNLRTKKFLSPKKLPKVKKRQSTDDFHSRVDEAYRYRLKKRNKESRVSKEKDECTIFGELVATKLRKMDEITRQYVMNDMNNLMFEATIRRTDTSFTFRPLSMLSPTYSHSPQPSTSYLSVASPVMSPHSIQSQTSSHLSDHSLQTSTNSSD